MDISYELANYLEDSGFGTVGIDIFVGQIPAEQNGMYIMRGGGTLHAYTPIEEAVIDIYVKATSANSAINTIEGVKRYIHRMYDTNTTNAHIYSILAIGDVEDLARDLEYAKIYKVTFQIMCRATALIS